MVQRDPQITTNTTAKLEAARMGERGAYLSHDVLQQLVPHAREVSAADLSALLGQNQVRRGPDLSL